MINRVNFMARPFNVEGGAGRDGLATLNNYTV
jgi:hypothetical protein